MQRVFREGESASAVVVQCVAEETNREPKELEPFATSIDTDAVDSLFERSTGDGPRRLTVEYEGCHVTVDEDSVTVEALPDEDVRTPGEVQHVSETAGSRSTSG